MGNVERWLIECEAAMRDSLKDSLRRAFDAYAKTPRINWVTDWPGQVRGGRGFGGGGARREPVHTASLPIPPLPPSCVGGRGARGKVQSEPVHLPPLPLPPGGHLRGLHVLDQGDGRGHYTRGAVAVLGAVH